MQSTHLGCECLESLSTALLCRVGRCSEDANGHWLDCDGLYLRQENIYRERACVVDGLVGLFFLHYLNGERQEDTLWYNCISILYILR